MYFYLDAARITSRELIVFYRFEAGPGWFPVHLGLS
jgi:hypothetical protein